MNGFRYSTFLFLLCIGHAIYYIITGIWTLVYIDSFIWVTGPKYDIWLVKTVGILILVIGGVILSAGMSKRITVEIFFLAVGAAFGLTLIDVYYASVSRIREVYLLDALSEVLLIIAWIFCWFKANASKNK